MLFECVKLRIIELLKIPFHLKELFFHITELDDLELTIVDFIDTMTVQFITGYSSVEDNWDRYLIELQNIKIARYLEIYQEAYDKKYN